MNWNAIKSKKVAFFGKQISATLLAMLALAGLASAGLLSYYGMITGTATVSQSVKLDDMQCIDSEGAGCTITEEFDVVAGNQYENGPYTLTNDADVDAKVNIGTECWEDGEWCDGFRASVSMYMEVTGYGTEDPFLSTHYKKYPYNVEELTTLSEIDTITYKYMVPTESDGDHKSYVVLDLDTDGNDKADAWVVEMMPPYTPSRDIWYKVTLTDTEGTFHIPGDNECTQQTPCTFAKVKEKFETATVLKTSIAYGAFPGTDTYKAYGGIIQVNGYPTWIDTITVPADGQAIFYVIKEFAINMMAGTYGITTSIVPA